MKKSTFWLKRKAMKHVRVTIITYNKFIRERRIGNFQYSVGSPEPG